MVAKKTKLLIALIVYMICLTALVPNVKASEISSGEIPVTIDLGDSIKESKKEFEIELKPQNRDYPMPEGTLDGVYSISITGADTKKLPQIAYNKVGKYTYTISQKKESGEPGEFDTSTYLLNVEVTRSSTTGRLQAVSTLYVLGESSKVAGAVFYNAPSPEPTSQPTQQPTTQPSEVKGVEYVKPKTGDENQMLPYIILFLSGTIMFSLITLETKKNLKEENDWNINKPHSCYDFKNGIC